MQRQRCPRSRCLLRWLAPVVFGLNRTMGLPDSLTLLNFDLYCLGSFAS